MAGSSEGAVAKIPLAAPEPLTKPWLEMMVPLRVLGLTFTWNVMVATFAVVAVAFAGIAPAVLPGALIGMPFCSAETPTAGSATKLPLRRVLPAT